MSWLSKTQTDKIDLTAMSGLAGTVNSLGYEVDEIKNHFHNSEQVFGLTAGTMARKAVTPIVVTGGSGAWGTEVLLNSAGTEIESGSSTKKFDLGRILVTNVGTINRHTAMEFYTSTAGTPVTSVTTTDAGDLFTKVGHTFVNTDRVILSSIVSTTGIDASTVYYVVGVAGNNFQVSLTLGGAAVAITTNGSCTVTKLTQTLLTENIVSRIATATDAWNVDLKSFRTSCANRLSCRAWAASGTNAISFYISLHTYPS